MEPTSFPSGKYIPQLDALRGIAIVLVFSYHFLPDLYITRIGWSGLDLFFVLSGYLLTSRLLPYIKMKWIVLKFYRNRLLRIMPLYFAFLATFFAGWFFLASPNTLLDNPFYTKHWWQFFLFIQNWVYIYDGPNTIDFLNHFWSLAVEEQYYIIFPVFIILLAKAKNLFRFAAALILVIMASRYLYNIYFAEGDYLKIYWNSFFRLDSFFIGVLLYSLISLFQKACGKYLRLIALLSLLLMIAGAVIGKGFDKDSTFIVLFGHDLMALVFAFMIYSVVVGKKGLIYNILSTRFLVFTGRISYGMYVVHWPIFLLGFKYISALYHYLHITASQPLIHYSNVVVAILISYFFGYLSFTYYESYFMKFKSNYR